MYKTITLTERELKQILAEAIGFGSLCWEPKPTTQVFDSSTAEKYIEDVVAHCKTISIPEHYILSKKDFDALNPDLLEGK